MYWIVWCANARHFHQHLGLHIVVSSFGIKFLRLIRQSQADQRISGSSLARFLRHGCLICLARGSDSLIGTSESRSTSNKQRRYCSSRFQTRSQNFLCTSDITLRNTPLIEWHITFRNKREGELKGMWKFFRYEGPIYFFLRCWFFKAYAFILSAVSFYLWPFIPWQHAISVYKTISRLSLQ